jgi:adenine-specific DNA-methyltransferase
MEKMRMHTVDITDNNIEKIGQLFPNCLTECIGEDGKVESRIDFDQLRQELSKDIVEGPQERYQFSWPDKKMAIRLANAPSNLTLRPCREESVDFDNTENLYIEGDNLEVLKLLREDYLGRIKMIYIDPPYNTGNDFVYEDDFSQSLNEYVDGSGQKDNAGNRLVQNTESNGRFHTDWLNMMYPRLKVARDLLKNDGVIFISIDDTEVSNLRKCCDEIFGAQNFIADLIWQKKFSRSNDATYFSTMHDHILCYCKNSIVSNPAGWKIGLLPRGDEVPAGYTNPDNDPRGVWTSVVLSAKSGGESLLYPITLPSGRTVSPPSGRYWSCSKDTFEKWKADNRIWFGQDGDGMPRKKTFLSEVQEGLRPNTIIFHTEGGHNQEGKQETKQLFDGIGVFDGPKPVRLLYLLLQIAKPASDDLIMDFFSGSATTAHAVEKYNAENETHLKFILVQLPEETEPSTEAYKAGYKTICEIGKERIRRAGKKISEEQNQIKTNGSLFDNADAKPKVDIGFRVLKLDSSNMNDIYYRPEEFSDQLIKEDNVKEDRTPLDLLFQVMLECNLPLSAKIKTEKIAGKEVFSVNNGYLIACFDEAINEDVIKAVAKLRPYYFVMRDSSLASDNVADNFEQIFQAYSKETIRKIL